MKIEMIVGDIVKEKTDAIVNAANSSLLGGGGVDGAIHKAAGQKLLLECRRIRREELPNGLETGKAIHTDAFDLPCRYIIHTVGPIYENSPNPERQLREAYQNSLFVAQNLGISTIAFPAISTGAFGYPLEEAANIAISAVLASKVIGIKLVKFVLWNERILDVFKASFKKNKSD